MIKPILASLLSAAAFAVFAQTGAPGAPSVPLEAARDALAQSSAIVIDIREPGEHATGVAQGARLLPMSQLAKRIGEVPKTDQPVLLICNTQNRSSNIAQQLRAAGYSNISYVTGGMSLWAGRQWPMVKP